MAIQIGDKSFNLLIGSDEIHKRVVEMSRQIVLDYKDQTPILLCLLNGSYMFAADLSRQLDIPLEISFIKISSYAGMQSTGQVNTILGLQGDISGRDILVVEDIIDTGTTVHELLKELKTKQPASIKLATLLAKPDALKYDMHIDYTGFDIADKFVVGYGMDYNELGRNLPGIYVLAE